MDKIWPLFLNRQNLRGIGSLALEFRPFLCIYVFIRFILHCSILFLFAFLKIRTVDDQNIEHLLPNPATPPTKTNEKPDEEYYDKRGAILSARKRTRSSNRQQRPKLSDDLDPGDSDQEVIVCTHANVPPRTPNKNVESLRATPEVRRSPRYRQYIFVFRIWKQFVTRLLNWRSRAEGRQNCKEIKMY